MKKLLKRSLVIAAALLVLCTFAAVAGGGKEPTPAGGAVNKEGKTLSIASVDFPQFQPYKVRTESEKKACDDYGIKYTLFQPQQVTIDGYLETLTNAINQDFDAIICEPWDYEAFKPVLELAKKKGVPLVSVHQKYPDPSYFISMLYINNAGYGGTAADDLGKATGGKANVLFMMTRADVPNQVVIRNTFIERCKDKWPNIKVVDTLFTEVDTMKAASLLEAALKAYPEIDTAIWIEGATVGVGVDVAKEMGVLDRFRVIGVDDPPDVIASIGKGEAWGTFVQNFWKQGYEAVRNVVDYYAGQPFPKETDCGVVLVDKSNWNNYIPTMWAPVALKGKPYPQQ
jgi:ribose transport system substrate-binding protein